MTIETSRAPRFWLGIAASFCRAKLNVEQYKLEHNLAVKSVEKLLGSEATEAFFGNMRKGLSGAALMPESQLLAGLEGIAKYRAEFVGTSPVSVVLVLPLHAAMADLVLAELDKSYPLPNFACWSYKITHGTGNIAYINFFKKIKS